MADYIGARSRNVVKYALESMATNPKIAALGNLPGKGNILPAPRLPIAAMVYGRDGGEVVAEHRPAVPCGGSCWWRFGEMFSTAEREQAGGDSHVIIRDGSCRLFGYHSVIAADEAAFSLDHMFGS